MAKLSITIAGAGIAGCAAAISLASAGHRVRILERAERWAFASSGIFVYANGLAALDNLGVLPEILDAGFAVPEGRNAYFEESGAELVVTHYPDRPGIPAILGIRRSELHRVLSARMAALGVEVELGRHITGLSQHAGGVSLDLDDGETAETELLVVAEGLRSTTRALIGRSTEPRYTGFCIWRSVHERPAGLRDKVMMMGRGKRFGIMPISDSQLYTFGTVPLEKPDRIDPAEWPRRMAETFAEFGAPARQFLDELGPESEILFTAVEEVALPLPWHSGRAVLIGDAAHASTPFMGQGGAMAMVDAVVLARHLDALPPEAALEAFGAERFPVCAFVQEKSRKVGQSGALESAESVTRRNAAMRAGGAQAQVDDFYARLAELSGESSLTS